MKWLVMCILTAQPCAFHVYEDQEVVGERNGKQDDIVQKIQGSSKDGDFTVSERLHSELPTSRVVTSRVIGILTTLKKINIVYYKTVTCIQKCL